MQMNIVPEVWSWDFVKNVSKNIINVIGGVYAMSNPKKIMKDKNFDYVVMGEGEYVFQQIVGFYSNVFKITVCECLYVCALAG